MDSFRKQAKLRRKNETPQDRKRQSSLGPEFVQFMDNICWFLSPEGISSCKAAIRAVQTPRKRAKLGQNETSESGILKVARLLPPQDRANFIELAADMFDDMLLLRAPVNIELSNNRIPSNSLLGLPTEIRLEIFRYFFDLPVLGEYVDALPFEISYKRTLFPLSKNQDTIRPRRDNGPDEWQISMWPTFYSLFRTNRCISIEATQLWFKNTKIQFSFAPNYSFEWGVLFPRVRSFGFKWHTHSPAQNRIKDYLRHVQIVTVVLPGFGGEEDKTWPNWIQKPDEYSKYVQDVQWLIRTISASACVTKVEVQLFIGTCRMSDGIRERFKMALRPLELFNNVELDIQVYAAQTETRVMVDDPDLADFVNDLERLARPLRGQQRLHQVWNIKPEAGIARVRDKYPFPLDVARQMDKHVWRHPWSRYAPSKAI